MQTPGEKEQRVQEVQRRQAQIYPTTGYLEPISVFVHGSQISLPTGDLVLG